MAGTIEARFRKHKAFCEQIGHRSFVIVPHEIRVKIPFEQRNNNNYDAHTQKPRRKITMKKYLMKYKVNMLLVVIVSILAGMAGSYFFDNRWLGMFIVIPMCALYIYQVYQVQADYRVEHERKKHKNKYR